MAGFFYNRPIMLSVEARETGAELNYPALIVDASLGNIIEENTQSKLPQNALTSADRSRLSQLLNAPDESPDLADPLTVGLHNDRIPIVDEYGLQTAEQVVFWEITKDTAKKISNIRGQWQTWQDEAAGAASSPIRAKAQRASRKLNRLDNSPWQYLRPEGKRKRKADKQSIAGQRNRQQEMIEAGNLANLEDVEKRAVEHTIEQGNCPQIDEFAVVLASISRSIKLGPKATKDNNFTTGRLESHWQISVELDPLGRIATGLSLVFAPQIAAARSQLDNPLSMQGCVNTDKQAQREQEDVAGQTAKSNAEYRQESKDNRSLMQALINFWIKGGDKTDLLYAQELENSEQKNGVSVDPLVESCITSDIRREENPKCANVMPNVLLAELNLTDANDKNRIADQITELETYLNSLKRSGRVSIGFLDSENEQNNDSTVVIFIHDSLTQAEIDNLLRSGQIKSLRTEKILDSEQLAKLGTTAETLDQIHITGKEKTAYLPLLIVNKDDVSSRHISNRPPIIELDNSFIKIADYGLYLIDWRASAIDANIDLVESCVQTADHPQEICENYPETARRVILGSSDNHDFWVKTAFSDIKGLKADWESSIHIDKDMPPYIAEAWIKLAFAADNFYIWQYIIRFRDTDKDLMRLHHRSSKNMEWQDSGMRGPFIQFGIASPRMVTTKPYFWKEAMVEDFLEHHAIKRVIGVPLRVIPIFPTPISMPSAQDSR